MAGPVEQAQFEELLSCFLSDNNEIRTKSEEKYNSIPPDSRIVLLLTAIKKPDVSVGVRSMAAVLVRRIYTTVFEEFWPSMNAEMQKSIKDEMLLCLQADQETDVRKKMCDAVAELARNLLDDSGENTWPEILKFLFESARSPNVHWRENALLILSMVPGVFGSLLDQYLVVITEMLQQCLSDQQNPQIKFVAVKATVAFIHAYDKNANMIATFRGLLPLIIQVTSESIQAEEDESLLKCLIELAEFNPKFLRPQLEPLITLSMQVVGNSEIGDQWRQLALELIVTLSETAPAMIRKNCKFLDLLIPEILKMMMDLEDDDEWSLRDIIDDEDADANCIAAESALDRLACGLGGKTILPHIQAHIPRMLANREDWKCRYAGLMAMSTTAEGCHKQMSMMLDNIINTVLPFLKDPHPRVRYAACNAIGQMSSDFAPAFQKKYHQQIVEGLLCVMDDNGNPRVQSHAGAALVNFSEDCPKPILIPYLDAIMNKLQQILTLKLQELASTGTKLVLEQIVTSLASVADTVEEKFIDYYDRFIPSLKFIIENCHHEELKLLRGKTIECISLIGLAVGSEKFMQDCGDVMQLLLKTQTDWADLPADDPQITYMIAAWARMCKIMGPEFAQYLPHVIGPVMKAAAIKPDVAVVDSDEIERLEKDEEWQFVTLGDQQSFGIKTAGLEEKATACQMLVCYARELKQGFADYTEQVVNIMVKHLKFYFHDGVRLAAVESFPYLLDCAVIKGADHQVNMWNYICPELLQALDTEPEQEVKSEFLGSLALCIEKMGTGSMNEQNMAELIKIIKSTLEEHSTRQTERQEKRKDEDYDEVVEEELLDEDDEDVYLLSKVADIMHAILGTYKEQGLPVFNQLLPDIVQLLAKHRAWADKQWGLCMFDDLIEHTGPSSLQFSQYFLEPMLENITSEQPEVRQASAYGVGVMAQFGGEGYVQACNNAVPRLIQIIQAEESRSFENVSPTENAISAITKICKYCPGAVNVEEVLTHWMKWLPVWEDKEEAVHIYNFLCDLVESNNAIILGANNANLPRIVAIITEAFSLHAVDHTQGVGERMLSIIKQLQANPELFQACVSQLSEELQQTLVPLLA